MSDPQPPQPSPKPDARRWPVRLILVAIVFALVLPGLVFCAVLLDRIASAERTRSQDAAQAAALSIAGALDRELGGLTASLVALSTSIALTDRNIPLFYQQAQAVAQAIGQQIVLADLDGQQLMNTRVPIDVALSKMTALETLRRAVATRAPAVSGLFNGATTGALAATVMVPVLRNGQPHSVLAVNIRPAYISALLNKQGLPEGWVASVTDANDRVLARSSDGERTLGQLATADFRRNAVGDSAIWVGATLDGIPVLAAMQRLRLADWRVGIGVPIRVIEAPLRYTVILLAITGAATLGVAVLLATLLASSVSVPLRRLARAGEALASGMPVDGVRSRIAEVDAVSRALVQATSDLRARADALAAERAQLEAVFETVPVGLLIADPHSGRIVAGNRHLERMLRHKLRRGDEAAWPGHHADGRPVEPGEQPLHRVLRGATHAELEFICQRGDGKPLWVRAVAAPILAPDGSANGVVVALMDVDEAVRAREAKARFAEQLEDQVIDRTAALEAANQRLRDEIKARAAAEDQLRQAQKMEAVGQLTGGIAHDFNNLLTIVMGSLDLLRRRAEDERSQRLLDNAMEGATRAATLTARLLAFSRRQPLSPQPVDLNRLVGGMSDLLHRTLGESIQVETVLAGGLWQAHADPNQLENALLNLAVNARDAMVAARRPNRPAPTDRLTIETGNTAINPETSTPNPEIQPGEYVWIAVTDTGTGMPDDVLARVFEPFYTTKPQGQGTGLGLSQVHGFVKQSGGHVAIRTSPGEGATVTIHLPRFNGPPEPVATNAAQTPSTPQPALTVLVVEDEPGVRRHSLDALRELGHTVLEAEAGAPALRLLDAHPEIALVFTDVMLPLMNGARLAEEIRHRRPGLPILFTSGYTGGQDSVAGPLEPGAILLPKPFTLHELAAKIDEARKAAGQTEGLGSPPP